MCSLFYALNPCPFLFSSPGKYFTILTSSILILITLLIILYTAEPDIPEPSLIEVELAIEKLKRHKATGVDHIPSELIQVGGSKFHNEEFHSLYLSPNIIWMIKSRRL